MIEIEICAPGIHSAENAKKGGAARIELCENLHIGGTTPTMEDVRHCVEHLGLRTHVLIRPRGGDFCYTNSEFAQIIDDIFRCKDAGAQCVVVGVLTDNGLVDVKRTTAAVKAAHGMEVTFHRAFDRVADPHRALEEIIDCGCQRVLTSGCQPTAVEGIRALQKLVEQAGNRIKIMAGSGVTPQNANLIIGQTGVAEIHASCKQADSKGIVMTNTDIVRLLFSMCSKTIA